MDRPFDRPAALRASIPGYVVNDPPDWRQHARARLAEAGAALHLRVEPVRSAIRDLRAKAGFLFAALPGASTLRSRRLPAFGLALLGGLAFSAAVFLGERDGQARDEASPVVTEGLAEPAGAAPNAPPVRVAVAPPAAISLRSEEKPWLPVRKPFPIYDLDSPDLDSSTLSYRVFTRDKATRQDRLRLLGRSGEGTNRPLFVLSVERHEKSQPMVRPLFADLAQRAAEEQFAVKRMAAPVDLPTKFGPVEAAESLLEDANGTASCLVFRRVDMRGLVLAGWACGTAQRPVDRVSLACLIDRLDLSSAGNDTALKRIFAAAERSRRPCSVSRQPGRKTTWLDAEAPMPALKTGMPARR